MQGARRLLVSWGALLVFGALSCASAPSPAPTSLSTAEAPACEGVIDPAPAGSRPVDDPALLAEALGQPGEGELCAGAVFEAEVPLRLYRVWSAEKPWSETGRWWSLAPPQGPAESYRVENAICPEWSALDRASACVLKAGSRFVMGPGQSATCAEVSYPPSPINQIFVDHDARAGRILMESCEPVPWP